MEALITTKSAMEKGTLFQLRNVINCRDASAKPKVDVNAAVDFFEIAVISPLCRIFGCHP